MIKLAVGVAALAVTVLGTGELAGKPRSVQLSSSDSSSTAGMHQLMIEEYPEMAAMHQEMIDRNPQMAAMHDGMMSGATPPLHMGPAR